jgi:hypothetical protein
VSVFPARADLQWSARANNEDLVASGGRNVWPGQSYSVWTQGLKDQRAMQLLLKSTESRMNGKLQKLEVNEDRAVETASVHTEVDFLAYFMTSYFGFDFQLIDAWRQLIRIR